MKNISREFARKDADQKKLTTDKHRFETNEIAGFYPVFICFYPCYLWLSKKTKLNFKIAAAKQQRSASILLAMNAQAFTNLLVNLTLNITNRLRLLPQSLPAGCWRSISPSAKLFCPAT
jgi:hypothetical protein